MNNGEDLVAQEGKKISTTGQPLYGLHEPCGGANW